MAGDMTVQLQFLKRLDIYQREKPYWLFVGKPGDVPDAKITHVEMEAVSGIPVHDTSNSEGTYNLDTHGFQFVTHSQTFEAFDDEKRIEEEYIPQVDKIDQG